jgi:hypothetical protein
MTRRPILPQRTALLQTPAGQAMYQKAFCDVKLALAAHGIKVRDTPLPPDDQTGQNTPIQE